MILEAIRKEWEQMLRYERTNVYDFNFHLVFVTKYRRSVFNTQQQRDDMKKILLATSRNNGTTVEKLEVMPDHVHMLLSFKPKYAPSNIVKSFKGNSAREWFKLHPDTKKLLWDGHLWSPSFFMSTVGNVSKRIVENYLENQLPKTKH